MFSCGGGSVGDHGVQVDVAAMWRERLALR
jgi:hypothetical protein